jgi:NADPH:quinone reductase
MRALLCKRHGPPEMLVMEEIEAVVPGHGEIRVEIKAAALNFFDTLIIENQYQYKPDLPFSPGAEVAGVVEAIGGGVEGFAPGDRVVGYLGYGGCRELVVAKADKFTKMPDGLAYAQAAGLTVTYGTTLHGLQDRGRLLPGETLVVLGAAGGVGQAAIEIGKIIGARVIACASSDEKLEFCKSLGADDVINYKTEDLKAAIKEMTGGNGADVIYDPVGGPYCDPALRAIAWQGRYLVIGFAAGDIPRLPLNLVLLKGCAVVGVFWGSYIDRQPARLQAQLQQLMGWCTQGKLEPHVHDTYPLEKTPEALRAIANREVKGKAIIVP